MKPSELKQLIKEEIVSILSERKFDDNDKAISYLRDYFHGLFKKNGIELDKSDVGFATSDGEREPILYLYPKNKKDFDVIRRSLEKRFPISYPKQKPFKVPGTGGKEFTVMFDSNSNPLYFKIKVHPELDNLNEDNSKLTVTPGKYKLSWMDDDESGVDEEEVEVTQDMIDDAENNDANDHWFWKSLAGELSSSSSVRVRTVKKLN